MSALVRRLLRGVARVARAERGLRADVALAVGVARGLGRTAMSLAQLGLAENAYARARLAHEAERRLGLLVRDLLWERAAWRPHGDLTTLPCGNLTCENRVMRIGNVGWPKYCGSCAREAHRRRHGVDGYPLPIVQHEHTP